jgi:hypothetical protein
MILKTNYFSFNMENNKYNNLLCIDINICIYKKNKFNKKEKYEK